MHSSGLTSEKLMIRTNANEETLRQGRLCAFTQNRTFIVLLADKGAFLVRLSRHLIFVALLCGCAWGCGPSVPESWSRLSLGEIVYAFNDDKDAEGMVGSYIASMPASSYF
jgi:hypothetical protein